jgi:hypothetical protein
MKNLLTWISVKQRYLRCFFLQIEIGYDSVTLVSVTRR